MWIEDYRMANNLELDQMAHRVNLVGRKILEPPLECIVSDTLIHILERSKTPRTHPRIADAIAIACNATQEQRDSIVDERHKGTWVPVLTKDDWRDKPITPRVGGAREVVRVDAKGRIMNRYKSIEQASKATGMGTKRIYKRCNRKLLNEFDVCDWTFRYANEWDKMTMTARLKNLGVDVSGD